MARLRTWRPTVKPIWASSPAACTAVVTTSVVLGRPPSSGGSDRGGGGGAGRAAAAGFAAARGFGFVTVFAAPAFFVAVAFVPLVFAAAGFAFVAVFDVAGFAFVVAVGFAAAAGDVVAPRRSPPMRAGRLERRLPSTLGSDGDLAAFFVFFLAVFSAMRKKVARARVLTGYSDAATRSVTATVPKK